ncbi:MAG: diadenylate cyclase, partial [Cohnella sp.]|nr:diadenylate cyclase [Cohnella sp.]
AVLIRSDSIVSASNALPTTQVVYWNRTFDVRESAAVGLSERCDALVLVVSDKGSTSFSIGGNLYPFSAS